MKIKKCYCFDDVLLVPQFSDILSRSEIKLQSNIDEFLSLSIPIVSSPMDTVTEDAMAISMSKLGGLGIIHRYNTVENQSNLVKNAVASGAVNIGAAIGVSGDYFERAANLVSSGARIICVDIAHGHHAMMRYALETLKNTYGSSIHIMAGNVAALEGFNDLADWGADSIRVGIGGGSICSTRIQTGHGVPTLQSIIDCSQSNRDAVLIADGGIRNSGDIVKALAAGADFVMLGSLLAGTAESPGEEIYMNGGRYKAYRGMASVEAQIQWRGHTSSVEGVSSQVPLKGSTRAVLEALERGIRSGLSYTGARTIKELQSFSKFIEQSASGAVESSTHINNS
jgi:IMP dehydrogenase